MNDKVIQSLIRAEIKRQNETLNLIPSENFVSGGVLRALGSPLTNKYAEGYPKRRYYGGNEYIDKIEGLCKARALKLFHLSPSKWHVNVQGYSGSPANLAVYFALVPFGEKIMGLKLDMGGHLTHGHKVSISGQAWKSILYSLNPKTELLDYDEILRIARKEKPKLIITGYTAYPRIIDFRKFRKIADAVGAYLLVDMSHFAGLVAGGAYPNPFPYADVVMTTTHKTLRGPRAALIFCKKELASKIDRAVFPGIQGGPHANQIAAAAVALHEAMQSGFKKYAKQVVKNAKALTEELKRQEFRLVSGGTDTHLLLIDLTKQGMSGKRASDLLEAQGIIVNKNTIPYDPRPPMDPSGIRIGTPALTTRGMKEKEMKIIGQLIADVLLRGKNIRVEVKKLCRAFPLKY